MIDRSGWPHGPWDTEEDEYAWEWEGVPCLILRRSGGYLCGYVAVPKDFVYSYSEMHTLDAAAHGGITFEGPLRARGPVWIGFDCAHGDDAWPCGYVYGDGVYRGAAYVRWCVNRMAEAVLETCAMHALEHDLPGDPDLARAGKDVISARQESGRDPGQLYWAWVREVGTQCISLMQDRPAYGGDNAAFEEAWHRFHSLVPCVRE